MGIFDNILGFFKKDENFEKYLINGTIKAYNKDTTADKKLEDYIKDKICLNDKVSIIKFIEFFKDAINYTKWFDDNKERMESRTINKSKESKNLFDSDYTDGSVIDMFIGGDTDTDDKKLFEEAITKILTVLKTPSDIKDLNVLTLCVMTKINHYLAKFSFYMCVKNVEISRVNKIADIMGSFIKTNQNNLISNYENEICKLLKCNLIDLETFVNNLPIKDIADCTGKKDYMDCMKDVSTLHDNIRTLQKNVINVQSYNTYADDVNKYIKKIKEDKYNDFVTTDNVKKIITANKVFGEDVDIDIVKTIMTYNFETKGNNIEYEDVIEDLNNVYAYLPTLEALYHHLTTAYSTSSTYKINTSNNTTIKDWFTALIPDPIPDPIPASADMYNTYNSSLINLIKSITNNKFDFVFNEIDKKNGGDIEKIYNGKKINEINYEDDLHADTFLYFPENNLEDDDGNVNNNYMNTVHVLCLFNKFIKPDGGDPDAIYKNFIKSYMKLHLYTIKDTVIKAVGGIDKKISETDADYAKKIYGFYNKFRMDISKKMFDCFKNIIQSSVNSLLQYIYIINGEQYNNKLNDLVNNIGKYYDESEYKNDLTKNEHIIYHLCTKDYDNDTFTNKILSGARVFNKVQDVYNKIKALLEKIYFDCKINDGGDKHVIAYNDIYNLTFKVAGGADDVISKLTNIDKIYEDMQEQIKAQIESKIKTIKDNEKEHKLKIENKLEQHINKNYIDDIKSNLFNLIRQTEERDIKTILKYEYNGKNIDVPTDDNYKKVKGQIKTYENTLSVVKNIKDNQLIENNTNFSKESTNLNNLITLYDNVKGNEKIKEVKTKICEKIKELINTAISELNATYTQICKYVNDNFLSGFNKFKNGLIKSTDDVVIQHVWFNALRKIHNIQSIQDIEKTEKPKNKYNILSLVNRKSTEIPKGDSQLIDKFFLNNHVPFNAANITSRINKISGGYKDDIECMNIYEQIFKRIQDILASRKIKLNASDTERINDKIKKLKRTEKRLLEIFKTMAYYTSIPDLTRRSDVSYDDMNETIDEYKHKYEEYHKLTDNMINSLNKLNKIVTEITNNINA